MSFIAILVMYYVIFFVAILAHEFGHVWYMDSIDKKVTVRWFYDSWRRFGFKAGEDKDYQDLTNRQYYNCLLTGIACGFAFIIILGLIESPWILIVSIPYLTGCWPDIKIMYRLFRGYSE